MQESIKFAATVVIYNPKDDVIANILSYSNAVDEIYVIDNSDIASSCFINEVKKIPHLEYICLNGNKGIAHALNIALQKAINNNMDYLLTMDQDTSFYDNDAMNMVSYIMNNKYSDIPLYAANTDFYRGNRDVEYISLALTSGNVIHCRTIYEMGGFDENLFIDWVDHDICYRLKSRGYKIARLNKIRIIHELGERLRFNIGEIHIDFITHSNVRYYYMTRNKFYVLEKNNIELKKKMVFLLGTILMIIKILLIESDKKEKISYIKRGIEDYFHHRMGKYNL